MTKIYIPFMESGSRIPLIEIEINGIKQVALLDTGSESTLFDWNIHNNDVNFAIEETDYQMSLIGLSGETEKRPISSANATIAITDEFDKTHYVKAEGLMSDLSNISENINERYGKHIMVTVILGSDFLKSYGAKIDYRKKILMLRRK